VLVEGAMGVRDTVYRGECEGATIDDKECPLSRSVEGDDECSGVVSIESGSASAST